MISAKAGVRVTRAGNVVRSARAVYLRPHLKCVVAARLAGIHHVGRTTISAGVEMTTGAGLHVITTSLHVPEEGFAQLNSCALVRNNAFYAENRRNGHTG